ncbi:unnamed protein product [Nezara viridula]|uniref:Uncharacterized protein n=1 Tax=Nezara viridula TaxID=85310 RepID=A0A9P0MWJ1_NEZVI|nr:unnamed protein product [Nezara viridula]
MFAALLITTPPLSDRKRITCIKVIPEHYPMGGRDWTAVRGAKTPRIKPDCGLSALPSPNANPLQGIS